MRSMASNVKIQFAIAAKSAQNLFTLMRLQQLLAGRFANDEAQVFWTD
jgi:hypothetical protein